MKLFRTYLAIDRNFSIWISVLLDSRTANIDAQRAVPHVVLSNSSLKTWWSLFDEFLVPSGKQYWDFFRQGRYKSLL